VSRSSPVDDASGLAHRPDTKPASVVDERARRAEGSRVDDEHRRLVTTARCSSCQAIAVAGPMVAAAAASSSAAGKLDVLPAFERSSADGAPIDECAAIDGAGSCGLDRAGSRGKRPSLSPRRLGRHVHHHRGDFMHASQ